MRKQNRRAVILFSLALFARSAPPSFAEGEASFYYSVSMGGFSSPLFTQAEYMDFFASAKIIDMPVLGSAFTMHYLIPVNPLSFAESQAGLGVDITLFHIKKHPFTWMSARETVLAPMASATVYAPFANLRDIRYTVSLSPLRLFAGYGYFSVGSFGLVFDSSFAMKGWGIELFEFSYISY
jgi:hypothetical protein